MIKISEAANLAIHALAYLGSLPPDTYTSATIIAKKLNCSSSHLSKVLNGLAHQGILASRRGARGGFSLAVSKEEITTLEIIEAVDGPLPTSGCLLGQPICSQNSCVFRDLFADLREQLVTRLGEVRLVDIPIHS
ncbi:MAG: Rrf2 family transcriptional regulator [bacterium]